MPLRAISGRARLVATKRGYSNFEKMKKHYDNIAIEGSLESTAILKYMRLVGGVSIIIVICSIMWASTMVSPVQEPYTLDLSKDVREEEEEEEGK